MARDVVVVVESELSERDAAEIAGLFPGPGGPVNYHLLLADDHRATDQGVAEPGVLSRGPFGSPAVARRGGAEPVTGNDPAVDLGHRIEDSARRLRSLRAGDVAVAVTPRRLAVRRAESGEVHRLPGRDRRREFGRLLRLRAARSETAASRLPRRTAAACGRARLMALEAFVEGTLRALDVPFRQLILAGIGSVVESGRGAPVNRGRTPRRWVCW